MANPKFGTLTNFDPAAFDLGVGSTISNGVLTVVPSGASNYDGGAVTKTPYDIAASVSSYRVNNSNGTTADSHENYMGLIDTHEFSWGFGAAQNILGFYMTGDSQTPGTGVWLQPVVNVAGADFSPSSAPFETTPTYLRIRETGGTTFWEYSADGSTWTTIYSVADPLSATEMGALYWSICVGFYNASDTPVTQHFDKFNGGAVAPAANPGQFFPFIR